jgi:hypothetical protein
MGTFRQLLVLLVLLTLLLAACSSQRGGRGGSADDDNSGIDDDDSGTDDDDSSTDDDDLHYPALVEISPMPDQADFFYRSNLVAEFDIAPEVTSIILRDASGSTLSGNHELAGNGRVVTFDPSNDLTPSAAYTMTVEWSPSTPEHSPLDIAFQTSAVGLPVNNPQQLIGRTYAIDLAGATFVEPPGIGPILQSQMEGFSVLFTIPGEGTNFNAGELDVMVAIGDSESGSTTQDWCAPTLHPTAGEDGQIGTWDDEPASWDNPEMSLTGDELPLTIQGVTSTVEDFLISGFFHPDLSGSAGGVFAGIIDTRPLVGALGSGEDKNGICDLAESTVGVPCISCTDDGDDTDEVFCLSLRAVDLTSDLIDNLTLVERPCEAIIMDFMDSGACEDEAAAYDADGDGIYELCPAF